MKTNEVLFGRNEFALRLAFTSFELRDAGRFFDQHAAIFRLRGDHLTDRVLLDDREAFCTRARIHEDLLDVAQTRGLFVDQVLGLARPVQTSSDHDFGMLEVLDRERSAVVLESQRNFAHTHRRVAFGSREDHIFHRRSAEMLRGHLTHHPNERVDDVRLAATVRTDDAGDAGVEVDDRAILEGFEANDFELLDSHAASIDVVFNKLDRPKAQSC